MSKLICKICDGEMRRPSLCHYCKCTEYQATDLYEFVVYKNFFLRFYKRNSLAEIVNNIDYSIILSFTTAELTKEMAVHWLNKFKTWSVFI